MLGRFDQAAEQGMGPAGSRQEFGVVLAGGEKGMFGKFDQFHQPAIGGASADFVARLEKQVSVGVVEFKAMAMALIDHFFPIQF